MVIAASLTRNRQCFLGDLGWGVGVVKFCWDVMNLVLMILCIDQKSNLEFISYVPDSFWFKKKRPNKGAMKFCAGRMDVDRSTRVEIENINVLHVHEK